VHLGHQALLAACRKLAEQHNCKTGAVTFTTHPDGLVAGKAPALLNTNADKCRLLNFYGMDKVVALPFDKQLMTTPWADFLQQLMAEGAAGFVCGDDFRFGAKGSGTAEKLAEFCKEKGLPCAVVPEQLLDGERISSTRIRVAMEQGDFALTSRLLGHPHILTGTVLSGKQLGRTIGVPTANLLLPPELIVPKFGVYATKVVTDGKAYLAVTNIGTRPTVAGEGITVEAHLLDFEGDLYGKEITVMFYDFLRPEQKFADLDALKTQIAADIVKVRTILQS
jgi:riboflavin kinase/FMN adenylyltransferase